MKELIGNDWDEILDPVFHSERYHKLHQFLKEEYSTKTIYPEMHHIFTAFKMTSFKDTRVVILGQDPYHNPNEAHGLAFSVLPGAKIPPSLRNIYKELATDVGATPVDHGNLVTWANQGVLLLNAVLTVPFDNAGGHANKGWEEVTDTSIKALSERGRVVFVLWGNFAKKKIPLIDQGKNTIIQSVHPSPLSASRGFFGSKPFSKINTALVGYGEAPSEWQLPEKPDASVTKKWYSRHIKSKGDYQAMNLFVSLTNKIKGKNLTVVFPEGEEPRILGAAARLNKDDLLKPILIGNVDAINKCAKQFDFDIDGIEIIDPNTYDEYDAMVEAFVERRKGKATKEQAETLLRDETYFGTMLVYMDKADSLVSGAVHSTANTVRPALQIIKTKPGMSRTSGAYIMQRGDERYLFADCAININPNAQELAEIAIQSAHSAEMFGIEPTVGMLSFSTKGSAKSPEVEKVAEATKIAHELDPSVKLDGEMQFDAAFVPSVAAQKAPGSTVAGTVKVFIFPELQSGNIGYKIAQRFGNFEAIGPVLQGLNKPVSDLSRGANEEDVYKTAILTAAQAVK